MLQKEKIVCSWEPSNSLIRVVVCTVIIGNPNQFNFGKAFKLSGIDREKVTYISKCGIMYPCEKLKIDVKHYDYSKSHLIKSVENSLKNLNTDYIDCLLLHSPSPIMDIQEITDTINHLLDKKMVRSFGVSNFTVSQMSLIEKYLKISFNQINFSLTNYQPMFDGTLDYMQINNIFNNGYEHAYMYSSMDRNVNLGLRRSF